MSGCSSVWIYNGGGGGEIHKHIEMGPQVTHPHLHIEHCFWGDVYDNVIGKVDQPLTYASKGCWLDWR